MTVLYQIEPRRTTYDPLLEICIRADGTDGSVAPAGRRFCDTATNGRTSYGLTDDDKVLFDIALARFDAKGVKGASIDELAYQRPVESKMLLTTGLGWGADPAARREALRVYRLSNPLPIEFSPVPPDSPWSNFTATPPTAAPASPPPVISADVAPSEAVYGFAAWLTGAPQPLVIGSHFDAARVASLVNLFCQSQGFAVPSYDFPKNLRPYPTFPVQPLDPDGHVPESFDAQVWADAFMRVIDNIGRDRIDDGLMIGWFANALMRGYDQHARSVEAPDHNLTGD